MIAKVSTACARMEEALQYLQDAGNPPVAPVLVEEIQDALESFVPQCILDQLKVIQWGLCWLPELFSLQEDIMFTIVYFLCLSVL